jgi:hypothetical protein
MTNAATFDTWHANAADSPAWDRIFQRALGLPPQVASNSLLTWAGLAEVIAALRVAPGQILVDLACGRGRARASATSPCAPVTASNSTPPMKPAGARAAAGRPSATTAVAAQPGTR